LEETGSVTDAHDRLSLGRGPPVRRPVGWQPAREATSRDDLSLRRGEPYPLAGRLDRARRLPFGRGGTAFKKPVATRSDSTASPSVGPNLVRLPVGSDVPRRSLLDGRGAAVGNRTAIRTFATASPSVATNLLKLPVGSDGPGGSRAPPPRPGSLLEETGSVTDAHDRLSLGRGPPVRRPVGWQPAREATSRDDLSLRRGEPYPLAGRLDRARRLPPPLMPAGGIGTLCEKGRAGGRARQPARPLAGQSSGDDRRQVGWFLLSVSRPQPRLSLVYNLNHRRDFRLIASCLSSQRRE